jgi:GH24 family phage-related lysozyme (muramidase)
MWNRPYLFGMPYRDVDFIQLGRIEDMKYSDPRLLVRKPDWIKQTLQDLMRHEGFRQYAYPDPLSKLGKKYKERKYNWGFEPGDILLARYGEKEVDGRPWTDGYGFTKGVNPSSRISKEAADNELERQLLEHVAGLYKLAPGWDKLPMFAASVLANMAYNLGLERFSKFKPTIDLILAGKYEEAAGRLRKTPWFLQVGLRAVELVNRLERQMIDPAHIYKP